MVVRHDDRDSIQFKRALDDDPRVDRCTIDSSSEQRLRMDHAMARIEPNARKALVLMAGDERPAEFRSLERRAESGAARVRDDYRCGGIEDLSRGRVAVSPSVTDHEHE